MEVIEGIIADYNEAGILTVKAQYDNAERFIGRRYGNVLIGLEDGRKASPEQIKKAHALINEIAEWSGELPDHIKRLTKLRFITQQQIELYDELFSLATCDMTIAKEYITYLVDFILEWDVPTKRPLSELCEDIRKYLYVCLKHKKCAVCGRRGELHHMEAVGMGNDRTEIIHEGMECMALCREHHVEYHQNGRREFLSKYHFDGGIKLDKELCKAWKVKARRMDNGSKEAGTD